MTVFASHFPFANSKKSSPGRTLRSIPATSSPCDDPAGVAATKRRRRAEKRGRSARIVRIIDARTRPRGYGTVYSAVRNEDREETCQFFLHPRPGADRRRGEKID